MNKKTTMMILAIFGLLVLTQVVLAEVSAPNDLAVVTSGRRDLSTLPDKTVDVLAGNVTQLSINAISITKSWAGFYGNVTGVITLDDASNNTFYNWTLTSADGEIFAARASIADFNTVACMSSSQITTEDGALNNDASAADSVTNTFQNSTGTHPAFVVGTKSIGASSCYRTNAFDNTGSQNTEFHQVLLSDGSNTIYTTLMNGSKTGFNGHTWDFELLVGEDGHQNSATTQYYFYVELN